MGGTIAWVGALECTRREDDLSTKEARLYSFPVLVCGCDWLLQAPHDDEL